MDPVNQKTFWRSSAWILGLMASGLVMAWVLPLHGGVIPEVHYVPIHAILEVLAVTIAMLVFAAGWNAHGRVLPRGTLVLACAFLGVGLLDLSHALSYKGMPVYVSPSGVEKAIDFWLAARLLAALALLGAACVPPLQAGSRGERWLWLGGVLSVVVLVHWVILLKPHWLPRTFDEGGLTPLKVGTEYVIVGLNLFTAIVLWRGAAGSRTYDRPALLGAVLAMAMSECFFTLYARVSDVYNILGHVYKIISYLFLYRAVFVEVIERPYRALDRAQDQLRATLDAVPDLLIEMDLQGRYHAVHSRRPELLLDRPAVLIGRSLRDVMASHPADRVMSALREAQEQGVSVGVQLPLPVSGGTRWFELSVARKGPQQGDDTRFIVLSRDITERIEAERARRAQEAAQQADRAKSEFLSRMSHELRTPLNAINGFAQLMLYGSRSSLPDAHREHVAHILKAGRHLLDLINEVLDLSRIEAGDESLEIDAVPLGACVADCLPMIAPQAQARGITVRADERLLQDPRRVLADGKRLRQILINLLSNAVKYNRDGGQVTVELQPSDAGTLSVAVVDTGIGLSPTQQQGLFEPFNRLGAEHSGVEGAGLGLVIARRLLQSMGGHIRVDSMPGQGSTFTITLLLADDDVPASRGEWAGVGGDQRDQPVPASGAAR